MTSEKQGEYGRLNPMLAALEALVKCESPTEDLKACNDVVRLASDIATRVLGTPAEIRQIEGRPVFWWGAAKPDVVLLAHLDTVWPIGSFTPLWQIEGDVLRGPGTYDMKAGFVQALFALKGITGSVALVGTTDEETGSHASRKLIQDLAVGAVVESTAQFVAKIRELSLNRNLLQEYKGNCISKRYEYSWTYLGQKLDKILDNSVYF